MIRHMSPALGSARDGEEGTACPTGHCSMEHQLTPDLSEPRTLLPGPGKLSPPPGRARAIAWEIPMLGEATQWAPRDLRRDLRGERHPWLALVARPDSPGESGTPPFH